MERDREWALIKHMEYQRGDVTLLPPPHRSHGDWTAERGDGERSGRCVCVQRESVYLAGARYRKCALYIFITVKVFLQMIWLKIFLQNVNFFCLNTITKPSQATSQHWVKCSFITMNNHTTSHTPNMYSAPIATQNSPHREKQHYYQLLQVTRISHLIYLP